MPFFFLYLYGNNNIMSDDLEKGLSRSKQLLSEMGSESGYLYDALTSIGVNIGNSIQNAIEGMDEANDIGKQIANTYKKDIVNSIKSSARGMDGLVRIQMKLNKGQNASKQINSALEKSKAKQQTLNERIAMLGLNEVGLSQTQVNNLNKQLDTEQKILKAKLKENNTNMKNVSLFKILSGTMSDMVLKLDKTGTLSEIMKGNFKETFTLARAGEVGQALAVKSIVEGVVMLDKMNTRLAKSFGLSDQQAARINQRVFDLVMSQDNLFLSVTNVSEGMAAIESSTGVFAGLMRDDVLIGAGKVMAFMGMSAEQSSLLATNAQTTGQHFDDQMNSMAQGVINAEQMSGVTLNANKIFKEAASVTGVIRANLGRNMEIITETVGKADALGLTLQDLAGISSNLLNFQSSIENELAAELFTGKQLNLEKARLYALTGEYGKLQDEIVNNVGSEYEFLSMNVLAKEKYAAALGMSVDKMSNLVMKNADLAKIEAQAREGGRQDIVDQIQSLTLAEEFNAIMVRVKETFIALAGPDKPLSQLASGMSMILENGYLLYPLLGAIAGIKLVGLVTAFLSLAAAAKTAAISGGIAKVLLNPAAGLLAVGLAAGAGVAIAASLNKGEKDVNQVAQFRDLPAGKMVSVQQGAAEIHRGEFVGHMSDFSGGFDKVVNAVNDIKLSFNVETHNATRYR